MLWVLPVFGGLAGLSCGLRKAKMSLEILGAQIESSGASTLASLHWNTARKVYKIIGPLHVPYLPPPRARGRFTSTETGQGVEAEAERSQCSC